MSHCKTQGSNATSFSTIHFETHVNQTFGKTLMALFYSDMKEGSFQVVFYIYLGYAQGC